MLSDHGGVRTGKFRSAFFDDSDEIASGLSAFGTLPEWLVAGMDGELVGSELERQVPELSDGRLRLLSCVPAGLHAKGDEWVARYEVQVAEGKRARGIVLVGRLWAPGQEPPGAAMKTTAEPRFGAIGWHGWLPGARLQLRVQGHDDALPALATLVDPTSAAELLQRVLRSAGYPEVTIASCLPQVLRYKPGSRCTVLERLDYADRGGAPTPPDFVVAKTHRGDKGQTAWAAMNALWGVPDRWRHAVMLAQPLAYLPVERILVQGPVPGEVKLDELAIQVVIEDSPAVLDRLRQALANTARGLAAIHRSGVSYAGVATFDQELTKVRELVSRLSRTTAQLQYAAAPLLEDLAQTSRAQPAGPTVSAHHTFRPAQVLLQQGRVGFIDFDGACMSEPALDIGRFRAKLRDIGICALTRGGRPLSGPSLARHLRLFDGLCEGFVAAYQERAAVSVDRVVLWETSDLLTAVLQAWSRVQVDRLEPRLVLLRHQLGAGG